MATDNRLDAKQLCIYLSRIDHEGVPYSGRGMFGKRCVGVELEGQAQLWSLALNLGYHTDMIPVPRTDNLGRGIIAYWPEIIWEDGAGNLKEQGQ